MTGVTRVQTVTMPIQTATSATALSTAFPSAITPGNYLLVLFASDNSNPGNYTISDNKGNTWTTLPSYYDTARGVGGAYCLANSASQAAAPTVTIAKNGTGGAAAGTMFELNCPSGAFLDVSPAIANGAQSTSGSVALGSNPYDHDLVVAILNAPATSFVTCTPTSGYSAVTSQNSNTVGYQQQVIVKDTTTSAAQTPGWTLTQNTNWNILGLIIRGTTTAPTITVVSTPTPANLGSLTFSGVNFGATPGTCVLGGAAQTVTAWSDTSVTVTVVRGNANKYGIPLTAQLTTSASVPSNVSSLITGLLPQAGWSYVDMATPLADSTKRIAATADLVATDQLAWDTKSGAVLVLNDGTASWVPGTTSSLMEAYTATSTAGWGTTGLQTFVAAGTPSPAQNFIFC